jgi:hypothetical protein
MSLSSLFVVKKGPEKPATTGTFGSAMATSEPAKPDASGGNGGGGGGGQQGGGVAVFLTPQSLSAFPAASLAVTVLRTLSEKLFPAWATSMLVPVIASFFVGMIIFLISISSPEARPRTKIAWVVGCSVAFLNAAYLAAVAAKLL